MLTCHTKIGPTGLILAEKFAKTVRPRPLSAKISPAGPLLAAKTLPPLPIIYYGSPENGSFQQSS